MPELQLSVEGTQSSGPDDLGVKCWLMVEKENAVSTNTVYIF